MRAALALCRAELVMLARNRTAVFNAVLIPLGLSAVWIANGPPAEAASFGAILQLSVLASMTVTATATITLVARRNRQVLERWRSSGAASSAILAGTVGPLWVLLIAQAAVVLGATAYATETLPARPFLLMGATALAGTLAAALAFVTAAVTSTVDSSNITAFPAMAALFGGAIWANTAEIGDVSWAMLATGGGAIAQLVRIAWDGFPAGASLWGSLAPALAAIALLTVVAAVAASRLFRWGPRN